MFLWLQEEKDVYSLAKTEATECGQGCVVEDWPYQWLHLCEVAKFRKFRQRLLRWPRARGFEDVRQNRMTHFFRRLILFRI